ncbi:MAG: hypothetical protein WC076_04115 [Terrimicrobiaceae bacterium]|nr:hypothetical protein [Terrimicrobiaceae bacterium]
MTELTVESGEFLKALLPSGGFNIPYKTRGVEPFRHSGKQLAPLRPQPFHPPAKSRKLVVYAPRRNKTMAILLLEGFHLPEPFFQFVGLRVPRKTNRIQQALLL